MAEINPASPTPASVIAGVSFLDVTPNTLAEYLLKLLVSFVAYLADAIGNVSVCVCMGVCESSSSEEVAT